MIKKHANFYGVFRALTQAEIEGLARFDVLSTDRGILNDLDNIKALNPDIELFRYHDMIALHGSVQFQDMPTQWPHKYWDEIDQHEDWFIHATIGDAREHRLIMHPWGSYFMDISNPEYRNFWINYNLELLEEYPWKGIFADDCWFFSKWIYNMWSTVQSAPTKIPCGPGGLVPEQPNFVNDMIVFLREAKASMGSKFLVPNTRDSINYPPLCNGMNREGWVHLTWEGGHPNYWLSKEEILEHGEELSRISGQGKYYMATAGIDRDEPGPEYERQLQLLSLAAFLISQNGPKASFSWAADYKLQQGFEEMFQDVGKPLGPGYEVAGTNQDVWGRDYGKVRALVNLNWDTPYDVIVDETEYTLGAYSGLIAPLETTPKPPWGPLAFLTGLYYYLTR